MYIYNFYLVLVFVYSGKVCVCDNIKNDVSGFLFLLDLILFDWLSDWDFKNKLDIDF